MALREKNKKWHYRFMVNGHSYSGSTGLAATRRNETKALDKESEHRRALIEGRSPMRRVEVRW